MSTTPPGRAAPRGHGVYLRVLDSVPPRCAEDLRRLATLRRRGRGVIGSWLRRARRRVARVLRRVSVRARRQLQRTWWRNRQRQEVPARADLGLDDNGWRSQVFRLVFPPTVRLPGAGPVTVVDARGIDNNEILSELDRFDDRTVFVVDDPNIAPLRALRLYYDYAPTTPEVTASERLVWAALAFGASKTVRFRRDSTQP